MGLTDHYARLGARRDATVEELHRAYRARARLAHPDGAGGTNADMAALNAAWGVLRDPGLRTAYDRYLGGSATAASRTYRPSTAVAQDWAPRPQTRGRRRRIVAVEFLVVWILLFCLFASVVSPGGGVYP